MTSKEITSHLPKWADGESMARFCRKIENVWDYCNANDVSEESFCSILYLRLPEEAQELVDGLDDDGKKKVSKIVETLKSSLDKNASQYFPISTTVGKKPTETVCFASTETVQARNRFWSTTKSR